MRNHSIKGTKIIDDAVGNNWKNNEADVYEVKTMFQRLGYYKHPIWNGIMDQELDTAIKKFQHDHDLKIDGYMKPGGETEKKITT